MVFYFGLSVTASSGGGTITKVSCDQCQSEYYYELTRVGTSSGHSPYGIAISSIEETASDRSKDELVSRLQSEAELVPCPKCGWISDELVMGFRRGRYRGFGLAALLTMVFGTAVSLFASWFVYLGPQVDRWCLPYLLVGGPLLSICLGIMILGLQHVLRLCIRPNANYPLPPRLPVGTPPALVLNTAQDRLVPVALRNESPSSFSEWHEFQLGRDVLPENCCECLSTEATSTAHEWVHSGLALRLLHCSECHRRSRAQYLTLYMATTVTLAALAYVLLKLFRFEAEMVWTCFIIAVLIALAVAAWFATLFSAPASFSIADSSRGVIKIKFRNPEFAKLFAQG